MANAAHRKLPLHATQRHDGVADHHDGNTNSWSPEQHAEAKKEIELYKQELRPLIRDANLYHVSPRPDGVQWDGIEYWDPSRRKGAVYAFRGTIENENTHSFVLTGLQPSARYHLRFYDHSTPDRIAIGKELMESGLKVVLAAPNSSEVVLLEEEHRRAESGR